MIDHLDGALKTGNLLISWHSQTINHANGLCIDGKPTSNNNWRKVTSYWRALKYEEVKRTKWFCDVDGHKLDFCVDMEVEIFPWGTTTSYSKAFNIQKGLCNIFQLNCLLAINQSLKCVEISMLFQFVFLAGNRFILNYQSISSSVFWSKSNVKRISLYGHSLSRSPTVSISKWA